MRSNRKGEKSCDDKRSNHLHMWQLLKRKRKRDRNATRYSTSNTQRGPGWAAGRPSLTSPRPVTTVRRRDRPRPRAVFDRFPPWLARRFQTLSTTSAAPFVLAA